MSTWIEQVKNSIPEHAMDIKTNLDIISNQNMIDEVDAHACAFAAAISSGNGDLAFEISMNLPLAGTTERTIAKTATALMGMHNIYCAFYEAVLDEELHNLPPGNPGLTETDFKGVEFLKFGMYALAASIASNSPYCTIKYYNILKDMGLTALQLQTIGQIASIASAVGKIAI